LEFFYVLFHQQHIFLAVFVIPLKEEREERRRKGRKEEDLVYYIYVMSIICWHRNCPSREYNSHGINAPIPCVPPITSQLISFPNPRPLLIEIKRIPAQRACASIARLEPLEQTAGVVHVLARRAALLRQLAVAADDAVADGALGLALERARDVAAERRHAVGDGAVLLEKKSC
jgi:hypothetical protein